MAPVTGDLSETAFEIAQDQSVRHRLAGPRLLDSQEFHFRRREQDVAESVHPFAGLLARFNAALTELVELIELVNSTSNCGAAPPWPRVSGTSRRALSCLRWAASTSRWISIIFEIEVRKMIVQRWVQYSCQLSAVSLNPRRIAAPNIC